MDNSWCGFVVIMTSLAFPLVDSKCSLILQRQCVPILNVSNVDKWQKMVSFTFHCNKISPDMNEQYTLWYCACDIIL